jgi:hypothetical protein
MCGSTDLVKQDGVFVCQNCGCKYSIEEAKKMMVEGTVAVEGTVKVDNSGLITSYLQMAENALNANNHTEAENYANKIIEIAPNHSRAWFIKGKAAGWQTTGGNNRYPESITNWINAYQFADDEQKSVMAYEIEINAMQLGIAVLQLKCNAFIGYRSQENCDSITNVIEMFENQLGELKKITGIDVYTDKFKTLVARAIRNCAVNASNEANKSFGPEDRNRDKFNWDRYTESQDRSLSLLDKAYQLSNDDDLSLMICRDYVDIATDLKDSCAYSYQADYEGGGRYTIAYGFPNRVKSMKMAEIEQWKKKGEMHDPTSRKTRCNETLALCNASRETKEKERAIAQYWEKHPADKIALENERTEITSKISHLEESLNNNPTKHELEVLSNEISDLRSKMGSLSFFKGKEKKALQSQIDDLSTKRAALDESWSDEQRRIEDEKGRATKRKSEIEDELTKDRGRVQTVPTKYLTLFNEGKFVPTALEIAAYHREVLPKGYTVSGEGEDAILNYRYSIKILQAVLLGALTGKKDSSDGLVDDKNDPSSIKEYRISILHDGAESHISLNFNGRTVSSAIEKEYYYILEAEKSPKAVSDFITVVSAAVLGICPNLNIDTFQTITAEVAFGLREASKIESDGIVINIMGNTKNCLKVNLEVKATQ